MSYNYCIIGTGRQGTSAAYDLVKHADINKLLFIDTSEKSINICLSKLKPIINNINFETHVVDIENKNKLIKNIK